MTSVQLCDRLPGIPLKTDVSTTPPPPPGHPQPRASRLLSQLPGLASRGSNLPRRIVLRATRTVAEGGGHSWRRRNQGEDGGASEEGQEGGRVSALRTLLIDTPRDQGRALRQRYLLFREQHRGALKPQQEPPRLPEIPFRLNPSARFDIPISGAGNQHNDSGCPGDLAFPAASHDQGASATRWASDPGDAQTGLGLLDLAAHESAECKVGRSPATAADDDGRPPPRSGAGQGGSGAIPRACAEATEEKNLSAWIAKSVSFAERPSRRRTLLPPTARRSVSEACLRRAARLPANAHAQHKRDDGPERDRKGEVREGDERQRTSKEIGSRPAGVEAAWQGPASRQDFSCRAGQSSHNSEDRKTTLTVTQKSASVSDLPEVGVMVLGQDDDLRHRKDRRSQAQSVRSTSFLQKTQSMRLLDLVRESIHDSDPQQAKTPRPSGKTETARAARQAESQTNSLPAAAPYHTQLRLAQSPFRRENSREVRGVEGKESCVCPCFPPLERCYCDQTGPSFTEGARHAEREWLNIVSSHVIDHNDYDRFARRRKGNKPSEAKCKPLA